MGKGWDRGRDGREVAGGENNGPEEDWGIMKDMRRDSLWIGMGTSFTKMEKRQCGWVSKQMNLNVGEES